MPITETTIARRVKRLLSNRQFTGNTPAVRSRQRIEQTICLAVAIALLDAGYLLGVYDDEETTIHHSKDIKAIQAALFTTDEDYLCVYVNGGNPKDVRPDYWVRFVYGNDGWDVMNDYSIQLDSVIGDGSLIESMIDKAQEGKL